MVTHPVVLHRYTLIIILSVENERMWWSARCGDLSTLTELVRSGAEADFSKKDHLGFTGLQAAAENGHADVVTALLRHGADAERANAEGITPLMYAAQNGRAAAAAALLEGGARVDAKCIDGRAPLHFAAAFGGLEVVRSLVEAGLADVNARDLDGVSPLLCAHQEKATGVVEYLESKGARM